MKCINCPIFYTCSSIAKNGGGCDMDGSDDFGCYFRNVNRNNTIHEDDDFDDGFEQEDYEWEY